MNQGETDQMTYIGSKSKGTVLFVDLLIHWLFITTSLIRVKRHSTGWRKPEVQTVIPAGLQPVTQ